MIAYFSTCSTGMFLRACLNTINQQRVQLILISENDVREGGVALLTVWTLHDGVRRPTVVWLPCFSHLVAPSCFSALQTFLSRHSCYLEKFLIAHEMTTSAATTPSEGTKFFFVTCTKDPNIETKETLREVRQHVMYEFHRKRKQSGSVNKDLSLRQRRISEGRDPPFQHIFGETESVDQPLLQQHINDNLSSNSPLENANCRCSDGQVSAMHSRVQNMTNFNPPSLQSHRFDPFDALPVNDSYIDAVTGWHFSHIVQHVGLLGIPSVDLMAKERTMAYWRKAQSDKGHFYSLICLIEAKRARLTGQRDDVQYLEHRGEVIRMLNAELNSKLLVKSPCCDQNVSLTCFLGQTPLIAAYIRLQAQETPRATV